MLVFNSDVVVIRFFSDYDHADVKYIDKYIV